MQSLTFGMKSANPAVAVICDVDACDDCNTATATTACALCGCGLCRVCAHPGTPGGWVCHPCHHWDFQD